MLKNLLLLARNSLGYLVANVFSLFLGIILLPVFTRYLNPTNYGIVSIAASVTGFLTAFYTLGLIAAYTRFYFDYKDNPAELKKHISTIVNFITLYGLLLTIILTFLGMPIQVLTPGVSFSPYIQLAIWSSYFGLLFQLRLGLYQVEQKANKYTILFIAQAVVQIMLAVVFVVFLKKDALGYIIAGLIANFVFSLFSFWLLRHYLSPIIDVSKLKHSLRYGLPLVPHMLGSWMFLLADRLILNNLVNTAETGLYAVGYLVGSALNLVAMAVNFAWGPFLFSQLKDRGDEAKVEISRFITYWILAMCFVFLLLSLFSREVLAVLSAAQYHGAYKVVTLIALGSLLTGFYFIVVNPLFWIGKTPLIAAATITSGLLNIGLNFALVPHMQMMGSALATALSCLYCFLFVAFFSLRSFPLPYEYRRLVTIAVATALCYLLTLPISHINNFYVAFAVKLPILVVFPLLLVLARFFEAAERKAAQELLRTGALRVYNSAGSLFGLLKGRGES